MDKLQEFITSSVSYIVTPLERDAFQVREPSGEKECIIQLKDSTCTCGEFQVYKFPCLHALAVCEKLEINPLQYVDDCYTLERYNKTYSATFNHVPEVSAWLETSGVPRLFPPVFPPPLSDETETETETEDEYEDESEDESEDEDESESEDGDESETKSKSETEDGDGNGDESESESDDEEDEEEEEEEED